MHLIDALDLQFAPHPMYSVGYAGELASSLPLDRLEYLSASTRDGVINILGYYGLSLIVASEAVLFVSLAAHFCQFGFLAYFENPRA